MLEVEQQLHEEPLDDPVGALLAGLSESGFTRSLTGGLRIAIAVGSRGIDRLADLVRALVQVVRDAGCEPSIVPAMGSHGGATGEGQAAVLASLGITRESVGAPVSPSMETLKIGVTASGAEAFCARTALESDRVIAINRVARHTLFSGVVESGVVKMIAVGLGKLEGARSLHSHGRSAGHLISEIAETVIEAAPPLTGVALVEDGTRRLSRLEVLAPGSVLSAEPPMLELAAGMSPGIPVIDADILIVDEMGKDVSGVGMDPNVTGRGKEVIGEGRFSARSLVVLRLTEASGGNATGVGLADITTRKLVDAMDAAITYRNVLTSGALERARIPAVAPDDREALRMAVESLGPVEAGELAVVRIRNTRHLGALQVSESLAADIEGRVVRLGEPGPVLFSPGGDLLW